MGYGLEKRTNRLRKQYMKLAGKINYMNKLVSFCRRFGRNAPCPCRSGAKFKKCCISNHDANIKKVIQLQKAMEKVRVKIMLHRAKLLGGGTG